MNLTKKTILVIDDDQAVLLSTKLFLEMEGFDVHVHRGFGGATSLAAQVQPDVILLDVNMPGLSGNRLLDIFKGDDRTKEIPVLFYSSNDEDHLRRMVADHGAAGYISKGSPAVLRRRLATFLGTVA